MPSKPPEPPPSDASVLAMDNIALDLPVAGVGSRALAVALDYVALVVIWFAGFLVLTVGLGAYVSGGWVTAAVTLFFFAVHWGYFTLFEAFGGGRTPGKRAVRLRVVGSRGGTASFTSFLLRNILRDVDLVIGVWLVALDPLSRRLGDRVGGTLVVHDRPEEAGSVVLGHIPAGWGGREVALAESYLRRSSELAPEHSAEIGRRLLALVARSEPERAAEVAHYSDPGLALRRALEVREGGGQPAGEPRGDDARGGT